MLHYLRCRFSCGRHLDDLDNDALAVFGLAVVVAVADLDHLACGSQRDAGIFVADQLYNLAQRSRTMRAGQFLNAFRRRVLVLAGRVSDLALLGWLQVSRWSL